MIYQYNRCLYTTGKLLATYPCAAMADEGDIWESRLWKYNNQVNTRQYTSLVVKFVSLDPAPLQPVDEEVPAARLAAQLQLPQHGGV